MTVLLSGLFVWPYICMLVVRWRISVILCRPHRQIRIGDMHTITLLPFNVRLLAHDGETVFHTIRRHGYPLASSCDGDGVCDKCRLRIVAGADNVTAPNDTELRFMRERPFDEGERMACQIRCTGDISVRATYW